MSKRLVVLGGGEAGVETALRLKSKVKDEAEVAFISDTSFFTYRPWITQVFRGKRFEDVSINLEFLLSEKEIVFFEGEVEEVSLSDKEVKMNSGKVKFDFLIVAAKTEPDYQSVNGAKSHSLPYHTADDAENLKDEIRSILESHDRSEGEVTITVCGAGPAGVELSAELDGFISRCCEESGLRRIDVKLVLLEQEKEILPGFPRKAREHAATHLSRHGVEVRTGNKVRAVHKKDLELDNGVKVDADMVIWTGGIKPGQVSFDHEVKTDKEGNIVTNPYMQSVSEAILYGVGNTASSKNVAYSGPETTTLENVVRQSKVVAHNVATNVVEGEKDFFEFKKTPIWISLGPKDTMMVWNDFVLTGAIAGFLLKLRNYHFRKRWK